MKGYSNSADRLPVAAIPLNIHVNEAALLFPKVESSAKREAKISNTLKAILLKYGYGITDVESDFSHAGNNQTVRNQVGVLVVNLQNDPKFFENLSSLKSHYDEDFKISI
jgi:hypothetical protein